MLIPFGHKKVIFYYLTFVWKDFNQKHMEELGHGIYTPMDIDLLPPLYLIYAENPSDSGKVSILNAFSYCQLCSIYLL